LIRVFVWIFIIYYEKIAVVKLGWKKILCNYKNILLLIIIYPFISLYNILWFILVDIILLGFFIEKMSKKILYWWIMTNLCKILKHQFQLKTFKFVSHSACIY